MEPLDEDGWPIIIIPEFEHIDFNNDDDDYPPNRIRIEDDAFNQQPQLDRPDEFDSSSGSSEDADQQQQQLYSNPSFDRFVLLYRMRGINILDDTTSGNVAIPHTAPTLNRVLTVIDDDLVCVICLGTGAESQQEDWVTAQGCDSHRYHSACIQHWTRGTCPLCRAPLS